MPDDDPEGVLSPEELSVADDDRVRRLDGDRYVVAVDESDDPPTVDGSVAIPDGAFALTARARAEDRTDSLQVDSDDVTASFEALVRWYAGLVAPDEAPEAVVATLLRHASLDVEATVENEGTDAA